MEICIYGGIASTNCPKLAPAALFTALYALTTLVHIYQAWHYKKTFCWVLIMGGCWEFIGMTTRISNIEKKNDSVDHTSFIFTLLAPLWINAFVYMVLGRMVHMYMPNKRLGKMKAQRLALYFVIMDISSFLVQLVGGILVVGGNKHPNRVKNGLHIYTAGTSLQEAVILVFVGLSINFSRRLKRESAGKDITAAKRLIFVLYSALGLITYRILFRILEFASPSDSTIYRTINTHEYFIYIFDITPMFLALFVFNVFHPGKTLQGPDSEYPKLTKEEKRQAKERRRVEKHARTESSTEMV